MLGWFLFLSAALAQDPAPPPTEPVPEPLVEPAPPPPASAAELIGEARSRLRLGDATGARIVLDQAADRAEDDDQRRQIAYLRGYAFEQARDPEHALPIYDALLAEAPTDDLVFRKASALAATGQYTAALALLATLGDPADRPRLDEVKLRLYRGIWKLESGDVKQGMKELFATLDGAGEDEVPDAQADARLTLLTWAANGSEVIAFTGSDKKKGKQVQQRLEQVKFAQDQLITLIHLGAPLQAVRGFDRVGHAYVDFGVDALAETPPKHLDEAQRDLNREALEREVEQLWITASQIYDRSLLYASQFALPDSEIEPLRAGQRDAQQRVEALPK